MSSSVAQKTCRGCLQILSLDQFYRHKQMSDGHLNYCKTCFNNRNAPRQRQKYLTRNTRLIPTHKVCSTCKRELPSDRFKRWHTTKDGLFNKCIECKRAYDRANSASKHTGYIAEQKRRVKNEGTKICPGCTRLLPIESYYRKSQGRFVSTLCKECNAAKGRAWRDFLKWDTDDTASEKVCSKCHQRLPASEFFRNPSTRSGLTSSCKSCTRIRARELYPRRRSKILHVKKRRNARRRGAGGTHTLQQWIALKVFFGNVCLRCGVTEDVAQITQDHVIPISKGGSDNIDNIQPLCLSCNVWKLNRHIIDYRDPDKLKQLLESL